MTFWPDYSNIYQPKSHITYKEIAFWCHDKGGIKNGLFHFHRQRPLLETGFPIEMQIGVLQLLVEATMSQKSFPCAGACVKGFYDWLLFLICRRLKFERWGFGRPPVAMESDVIGYHDNLKKSCYIPSAKKFENHF